MLNEYPIIDGFCYSGRLTDTPYFYQTSGLVGLQKLRMAKGYIPRIYACPDITAGSLPNYSNFTGQVRVVEGSYVWAIGLGFYINDNIGPPFVFDNVCPHPQQYFFDVRDEANGVPIFSDWINADNFFVPIEDFSSHIKHNVILNPIPMSVPRPIMNPGIISVNISNANGLNGNVTTVQPQVVLYCAEPCKQNQDMVRCS